MTTRETILIIDNRRDNIELLADNVLRPNGYGVSVAYDGEEGLARALDERPDLIITDLKMPGMDGLEVCKKIQQDEHLSHIKIVIISGFTSIYDEELEKLGVAVILEKPFTFSELNEKLNKFL